MNRRARGQPKRGQSKRAGPSGGTGPSPNARPQPKMASGRSTARGGEASGAPLTRTPSQDSFPELVGDPFASQSSGDSAAYRRGESALQPPSPGPYMAQQEAMGSPASSLGGNMVDLAEAMFSQASQASQQGQDIGMAQIPQYSPDAVLLARFSTMLQQELAKACTLITTDLKRDIHSFGERFDQIETKVDGTVKKVNQNADMITDLQNRLEEANNKIEDLENRSRRYNVRIRGLPETCTDLEEAMGELMKELIPDIAGHHMEIDRIHRALTAPRQDGLPRDVIAKPHFYRVKEKLMLAARNRPDLLLRGAQIQLFTDLAPSTVMKHRNLKPLLQQLINKQIKYRWSFPFRLSFAYKGRSYSFTTFQAGEDLLLELGIITRGSPTQSPRQVADRPISPLWQDVRRRQTRQSQRKT